MYIMYIHTCIHIFDICIGVCMCVYIYVYAHIHIYVHSCIHTCIHMYKYTHIHRHILLDDGSLAQGPFDKGMKTATSSLGPGCAS